MPWCDDCDRYLAPNAMGDDGTCPTCGRRLVSAREVRRARAGRGASADARAVREARAARQTAATGAGPGDGGDPGTPWHFKVLLVALILYLAWRLVQGIGWVVDKL